ncbi:type VI secretion system protein TssA [Acinetobacter rudis]|uniref:ImpA family type VI secretion-associated protein n=1 Tax=Acinetobacter rudis CIP 110305 TaxID=421052 RepID=S3P699_9GAMM|nr:type VI secretion system protein TssA [Acinetobacter rudis]EPF74376.1 ImpA family type VI secretion-associated protein [Acinetobacter rudis CIP 110305]
MISEDTYNKPIDENSPAGINVEYDEDYQKLLVMLQTKPEQQFGDLIVEAQEPDWEKVFHLSSDIILSKSKDLSVMSYFTQSGVICYGLNSLSGGLKVILSNLESYWEDIYPKLHDEDEDYDPEYRINALSLFNSLDGIVRDVRNSFIVKNGLSQTSFNIKDIENILDNPSSSHEYYPGGLERLNIDIQISSEQSNSAVKAVIESLQYLEDIKTLFIKYTPGYEVKFENLEKILLKVKKLCVVEAQVNDIQVENSQKEINVSNEIKPEINQVFNLANYTVSSRKDVDLLLEKIYLYFEKHEPSHPAPLFIRRIQRLMNLNFYEIMKDISPDSLNHLETLVGQPIENDTDY